MIFGKHINRYYLKYAPLLLLGLAALMRRRQQSPKRTKN